MTDSGKDMCSTIAAWDALVVKRRSSRWFWVVAAGTFVAVAGLVVYMVVVGLDKVNAVAAPMIVLETLVLIGLTAVLLIKPEGDTSQVEVTPTPVDRVVQRADGSGRNYYAGRDLTIAEDRSGGSNDVKS